ncbi:unnamed protein product, partial [Rotaria sp. Silwood1]
SSIISSSDNILVELVAE